MAQNNLERLTQNKKIHIITNVLTKALKLWLKSQVSQVSQLEVEIKASDRDILSGYIPWVSIFASHVVYQDIHLTQIQLVAQNIRINIGSVLKGQPLRLLETVPVVGEVIVEEDELNASVSSSLLSTALNDVLDKLLPEQCPKSKSIFYQKIILDDSRIILYISQPTETNPTVLEVCADIELLSAHELHISYIQAKNNRGIVLESHNGHYLNLGSDVDIQHLKLFPGKLVCHGRISVNP
ncbi:hypothetical protein NIES592_06420 [Fischerella major NIES-592]|uniref:DUF2993 domain-containing protein n=2 Tax=Fischerella TaxID=1190 RepID=A0A1U7H3L5_9CYAN|nr:MULTISPECIES: DUF2993 domain-containing protein [Fischerella]OKH15706.1 hypothetical protein NIES592_06420 [Fischerella major NIES-592]PMB41986.1 DUF2993 domain-containing protein [Fischerella thermalis CCMEE 5330]BAU04827.1 hypothetical protein FIS3754_07160 [Fischerella sp. NIES-3754]BCX07076.1 MAG: hypothetical protein KatS3mg066_0935 [Fischerella sp.]